MSGRQSQRLKDDADRSIGQAATTLERGRRRLAAEIVKEGEARLQRTRAARDDGDEKRLREALDSLSAWVAEHEEPARQKSTAREYAESIVLAVVIALFLRAFVVEAFKIPSGSMLPTLEIGDHIFVNKFLYGLRVPFTFTRFAEWHEPERGDVVVFINPQDEDLDYIKRVVGVAGDSIEVRDNRLHINGAPVELDGGGVYELPEEAGARPVLPLRRTAHLYRERIGEEWHEVLLKDAASSYGPVTVEAGHVFVMGDNRDNSSDSRVIGQIPLTHVKGKAMIVWWSAGPPDGIRWGRIGSLIP